jgi:hypothetical protein
MARGEKVLLEPFSGPLGPMPRLYRLAVLQRLLGVAPSRERAGIRDTIKNVFEFADFAVRQSLTADQTRAADERLYQRAPIQHGLFNMLELAAYFTGVDYHPLEGLGGPFGGITTEADDWKLVGPDPTIALVHMPRSLALAELDARGETNPRSILFRLDRRAAQWKTAPARSWEPFGIPQARLLAHLLERSEPWTKTELRRKIAGGEEENLRQIATRFRKAFRKLTRCTDIDPLPQGRGTGSYCIAEGLTFFGAVAR